MKIQRLHGIGWCLIPIALLASCGGGDDSDAGSPTTFSVVPDTVEFTAPKSVTAGTCVAGGTSTVFVYGGSAPYRIDNTVPDYVSVDKTSVGERGGSFTITVIANACLAKGSIVVVDKLDHIVTFTVDNSAAASS